MNKNICIGLFIVLIIITTITTNKEPLSSIQQENINLLKTLNNVNNIDDISTNGEVKKQSRDIQRYLVDAKKITANMGMDYVNEFNSYKLSREGNALAIQDVIAKNETLRKRTFTVSDYLNNYGIFKTESDDSNIKQQQYTIDSILWGILVCFLIVACGFVLFR